MQRIESIKKWLETCYPGRSFSLESASADASFRRYFRVLFAGENETAIVMDAPPDKEDCRPWLHVQGLFSSAGAHVPAVIAQDLEQGFLLLSDLGNTTYLSALDAGNADALYGQATDALIGIQQASKAGLLPDYDRLRLTTEMELFPVWYLGRHKGVQLDADQANTLYGVFDRILDVNLAEPQVFVHRDYHARNLMLSSPNPGIVDFQDAVHGPISYDLVSLFKDAYIHWEEERTLDWLIRYWDKARRAGLPVRADFAEFHRDYEFMGAQRHLKVLGIFARLYHRDGKDGYLKDLPLVLTYLRRTAERYRELHPLARLLDKVEGARAEVGYTF